MEYTSVKEALKIANISRAKFYKIYKLYPTIKEGRNVNIEELKRCIKLYEEQLHTRDTTDTITQTFTTEEYEKLEKIIREEQYLRDMIQNQRNEIAYLRGSLEGKDKQIQTIIAMSQDLALSVKKLTESIQQRNYIEAKTKGLDE